MNIEEGEKLLAEATRGEWSEDDGNIFSVELGEKRREIVRRRRAGEDLPHPDHDGDGPMGFICGDMQRQPKCDEDAAHIAWLHNNAAELLRRARAYEELVAALRSTVNVLRDRDKTTHRGLQWAHNEARGLDALLARIEARR